MELHPPAAGCTPSRLLKMPRLKSSMHLWSTRECSCAEAFGSARLACCSMGSSFLSDRPNVWPEMEKYTPSMRASCLVISAEPIQECSTSPAGNGPAWHVQSCSRKDAALYRAHCVRVISFLFSVLEALHQAGGGAQLAFCTMLERSPKAFTQCTCNAATPGLDVSSMQACAGTAASGP